MGGSLSDMRIATLCEVDAKILDELFAMLGEISEFAFSQDMHALEFSVVSVMILIVMGLQVEVHTTAVYIIYVVLSAPKTSRWASLLKKCMETKLSTRVPPR